MKFPIDEYLSDLHRRHAGDKEGKVADYIPELFKANPDWFGICIATTDGQVYEVGDSRQQFTIQSISKPFAYGIALEDNGREAVLAKVGVEPTGDAFNSISLHPTTGQPANPMINAGAIAISSLVLGETSSQKIHRILDAFSRYVGRELTIDEAVYRSESETGHRNRAISHLLRNFSIIPSDPEQGLDAYFRQCSINVTCRDLAIMASTLANNGINPVTGNRAIPSEYVGNVLGVMTSCGMYDYAGAWIYRVGLPAKSGVGGGIVAVLPGQLGIGIFSPPLDALGNSVRGIKVCEDLSRDLRLHMLRAPNTMSSVIRRTFNSTAITSNRLRPGWEMQTLGREGRAIQVIEIQGELVFSFMEKVVREAQKCFQEARYVILNFRHVQSINDTCIDMLLKLWKIFQAQERELVIAEVGHLPRVARYFRTHLSPELYAQVRFEEELDTAMEWAESSLLRKHGRERSEDQFISTKDFVLCHGFTPEEISEIEALLKPRSYRAGEEVLRVGEATTELFFLKQGKVSVIVESNEGHRHRVVTYSPGMAFGEVSFLDRSPRSATVHADTDVTCDMLDAASFDALAERRSMLALKLLRNIAIEFSHTLRRNNNSLRLYSR
ncbi:MAG: glutaminase A [Methylacidiphilales bacterium]|nr:glutaminase A [Candidatus Methylacidiphilales bacterium]